MSCLCHTAFLRASQLCTVRSRRYSRCVVAPSFFFFVCLIVQHDRRYSSTSTAVVSSLNLTLQPTRRRRFCCFFCGYYSVRRKGPKLTVSFTTHTTRPKTISFEIRFQMARSEREMHVVEQ